MKIQLSCAACGNNRFSLDEAITDECMVRCRDCGHGIGTLGQLKSRVAEEVISRARDAH